MKVKKRVIAIILGILMILNTVPTTTWAAGFTESWQDSGIPDTQWYDDQTGQGKGPSSDPYVIDNVAELAGLAKLVNEGNKFADKCIKLDADIDLGGKEWVPIGTNDNRFYGVFDGDGHIISNLTMHVESDGNAGLFGYIGNNFGTCGIKNLGVVDVNIDGEVRNGGALAGTVIIDGFLKTNVFENCFSSGKIASDLTLACLGGLFGEIYLINATYSTTTVKNCYSACDISATCTDSDAYYTRYVGGLIGHIQHFGGTSATFAVSNSYSASKVYTANLDRTYMGGFVGYVNTTDQIIMTDCMFDAQAAGISYGFAGSGASFDGVEAKMTSDMTGTNALPAGWSTSEWQAQDNLYPYLSMFNGQDSAIAGAVPIFLFENSTTAELSDTSVNVRHDFTVPVLNNVTWSAEPSGILEFTDGQVTFTSPASDTEVTITATLDYGVKKEFNVLCKSGVNAGDTTSPEITIGDITASDLSANIPVTSNEAADIFVLVQPSSENAPNSGDILADGSTIIGNGTEMIATVEGLQDSSSYTAYAIGIDATGNVSDVVSAPFTTLQDQTPPSWTSYSSISVNGSTASFSCSFSEAGTFKYVILPEGQTPPTPAQVAAGVDSSGNAAYFSDQQPYAGSYANVVMDISTFAPKGYNVYLVCVDAYGNISSAIGNSFTVSGNVTFTVTNGTDLIEGAEVTVGTETKTTDAAGKAVFTLEGGSYTYQVTAAGYRISTGNFVMDLQEKSLSVEVGTVPDIIDAVISPTSVSYDFSAPDDVDTNITWNSANAVTDVEYDGTSLTAGDDYVIAGDTLTIKSDFINSLGLVVGETADFIVSFDTGSPTTFTINMEDNYIPSGDADLMDLTVNGSTVSSFNSNVTTYNVELPYGTMTASVDATPDDALSQINITQAASLPGSATVTVTAENTAIIKTYTINFTLGTATTVPVSSITVAGAGGVSDVMVGSALQMQANVLPDEASNQDVIWSIENGNSASINENGLLTATSVGTVTVRATAQDGSGVFGEKDITITNSTPSIKTLLGISAPTPITGVVNGVEKTASALGLPSFVTLVTDTDPVSASVVWDLASSSYDPLDTDAQNFDVNGTILLPLNVINLNNLPLSITTNVAVNAATSVATAPAITADLTPVGTVGTAYSQTLTAKGDPTIIWSIVSGSLPAGLTLSDIGIISGIPTTKGTFKFNVKAVNSAGSDIKTFTFVISSATGDGSNNSGSNSGGSTSGSTGSSGGASQTVTRDADIHIGDGTNTTETVQIPISRTTNSNGNTTDSVRFNESQASAIVTEANQTQSKMATIDTTSDTLKGADITEVELSKASNTLLSQDKIGLNLVTDPVTLLLPAETVAALNNTDVSIKVSELTDAAQVDKTKGLLLQLSAGAKLLSNPISIVTNYAKQTQITLPIDSTLIPTDESKLDEFLASLAVLVEHSDGETRLQKGSIVYDQKGKPAAVSIWVDKFSTFTLVQTTFSGTDKVLKNKQMPDKVLKVKLNGEIDAKTVTEDNVYVLDSKGNKVDVTLKCDGSYITVKPVKYYTLGETYTLYITGNVLYKTGTAIESARKYQFTIGKVAVSSDKIKEYTKIAATKVWTINLSKEIDVKKLKAKNVTVVDQYCKKIEATISVVKGSYIQVKPKKSYKSGQTYYIIIDGVKYTDGTVMSSAKSIKFTIDK